MVNLPAKEAARTIVDLKKNCTPDIRRMGCPGGTRSVFTRAFRAKRELQGIFLGKKAIVIYYIQRWHNDLFFSLQSYSRKT